MDAPTTDDSRQPESPPVRTGVVVPVKAFGQAKGRLAGALSGEERTRLARRMASGVLAAAAPLRAWVICDDAEVADWADGQGVGVIWQRVPGLNAAVTTAVDHLGAEGFDRAIVAHGDLPLATELAWVGDFDGVTIVPDRRGEGTNVLSVPTSSGFRFRYGARSAHHHRVEAERLGLRLRIVPDERLGWDVDTPDDLLALDGTKPATDLKSDPATGAEGNPDRTAGARS